MTQSSDVVLAGSKPFLAALLAPLTQRVGVRPRVAGDPQQTRTLCQGPIRLLVFEYQGEQWLPLCRELSQSAVGVPVMVAALSPEQTSAQPVLAAVGVGQSSIWGGNAEQLLEAVDRALAAQSETPAPVPAIEEDIPVDDIPIDEDGRSGEELAAELFGAGPAPSSAPGPTGGPPVLARQTASEPPAAGPPVLPRQASPKPHRPHPLPPKRYRQRLRSRSYPPRPGPGRCCRQKTPSFWWCRRWAVRFPERLRSGK
jgi:hypothetical protein